MIDIEQKGEKNWYVQNRCKLLKTVLQFVMPHINDSDTDSRNNKDNHHGNYNKNKSVQLWTGL